MSSYNDLSGYQDAYNQLLQQQQALHSSTPQANQQLYTRLNNATDQFKSSFNNLVGRDPTNDEINQFLQQSAGSTISQANNGLGRSENDPTGVTNSINSFIGNNFHKAATDFATQQLQDQQTQADSLADLYRTQGNTAIDATQQSLLDYQSKLFDRLRPNLLTSLKSQGLLDTGGLNEAVAGVQGDLANNASNYIAQLKLQNEQGANQIAFSGASAPYQYQQSTITGQPSYLQGAGASAANFNNNTFMSNLDYSHQLGLIGAQAQAQQNLQPSFMRTFGQSAANSFGQNFNFNQGGGGGGGNTLGLMSTMMSTRKVKKDISQLTEAEEDKLYDQFIKMPLNRWRYKSEVDSKARHLGVIIDEALPELVTEDGEHLSGTDYLGMITLALKVQHRRMVA